MRLGKASSFSVEKLRDSAADIQRHTGLPDYSTFLTLYRFLRPKGSGQMQYWGSVFKPPPLSVLQGRQRSGGNELGRHRKLSPMDELLLTLIRLWRGSPRKELASRFGVSESVVTRVFITWCNVMYEHFQQLPIVWSSETEEQEEEEGRPTQDARGRRQHAVKTVPAAVKEAYLQAAAYLTQSALPVGSKTRAFDKPLSRDRLVEFLERYSTADGSRDEDMEEELGRPEQSFSESDES
ncbi:uncharacterized protein LOC115376084 [Myripristis murdjan]|uniref:uncharacterized protein LOC115376084 n=1 Tax=Myripristis murdjan TaxID=586833 RepID=UPI001175ED82|nr:uncharacterized protein LOC115376084 [Myripristis murdjan]